MAKYLNVMCNYFKKIAKKHYLIIASQALNSFKLQELKSMKERKNQSYKQTQGGRKKQMNKQCIKTNKQTNKI